MHLITVGFNYKKTPLALREALAFDRDQSITLCKALLAQEVIEECFMISTCNRSEVYAIGPCSEGIKEAIYQTLAQFARLSAADFFGTSYDSEDADALQHLFRVASSLDAMVVGEVQILGQLKSAYQMAAEHNSVGPYLHKACHAAFRVAKRVRTETDIATLPVSVGTLAVELMKESLGDLANKNILILGAGEMSSLVAKHLKEHGATHMWIANRTQAAAESLASIVDGLVVPFRSWPAHAQTADIIISSVAGGLLIKHHHVKRPGAKKRETSLVILDLAIPRNVDESLANKAGVKLYNIDNLQWLAEKNLMARREAAEKAEHIVASEAKTAFQEMQHLKLAPILNHLQQKCALVVKTELNNLFSHHPSLTADERESIKICTQSIVKKILHDPIRLSKEELVRPDSNGTTMTTTLQKIFHLGEEETGDSL